jgi:hypothetical protein
MDSHVKFIVTIEGLAAAGLIIVNKKKYGILAKA